MSKVTIGLSLLSIVLGLTGVVYMSRGLFAQSFMDLGSEYKFELGKARLGISRLGSGKISDHHHFPVGLGRNATNRTIGSDPGAKTQVKGTVLIQPGDAVALAPIDRREATTDQHLADVGLVLGIRSFWTSWGDSGGAASPSRAPAIKSSSSARSESATDSRSTEMSTLSSGSSRRS